MKKILWISPYAPFDNIDHAGGKTHNYYIKYFNTVSNYDITLLSLCFEKKSRFLKLDNLGIKNQICIMKDDKIHTLIRYIMNIESEYNPFHKYAGGISNYQCRKLITLIKEFKDENNTPDLIIMHWTQVLLLLPIIKNKYPDSKLIAIEEDVLFLAYQRKIQYARNYFMKKIAAYKFKKIYSLENKMLYKTDLIVVNNKKDADLLLKNGHDLKKIFISAPYFDNYIKVERHPQNKNIIYYGAMGRKENYLSAVWFIKNVMPLLEDKDICFLIIGGGADKNLSQYKSDRIQILGFVEDVGKYFSDCLCLAAPLVLGAGIKVKILEALSAGIPVLTNDIGIEGICAEDGRDYLHCETPGQYADTINKLLDGTIEEGEISDNARLFIQNNYDLDRKLKELMKAVNLL